MAPRLRKSHSTRTVATPTSSEVNTALGDDQSRVEPPSSLMTKLWVALATTRTITVESTPKRTVAPNLRVIPALGDNWDDVEPTPRESVVEEKRRDSSPSSECSSPVLVAQAAAQRRYSSGSSNQGRATKSRRRSTHTRSRARGPSQVSKLRTVRCIFCIVSWRLVFHGSAHVHTATRRRGDPIFRA